MLAQKLQLKYYNMVDRRLSYKLLKSIMPVDTERSDTIVIFNQGHSKYKVKLYSLLSLELSRMGILSFFFYRNDLLLPYYPDFIVDGYPISSAVTTNKKRYVKSASQNSQFFEWDIDLDNERIESQGVNLFPVIRNTLRALQKRYNVHFFDKNNEPIYKEYVKTCDLMLKYFLLLKKYSKKTNKKIRIVGHESNYMPNGIFKILCDQFSEDRDIEFVDLRRGYMSYFGEHHFRDSYITCANLTNTKKQFAFAVSKADMESFRDKDVGVEVLSNPAASALKKNVHHQSLESQKYVIETMQKYRSEDKNIFCLFAHLFYDTPIYDNSPSFEGMCEWILKTIDHFAEKEDLLIVKPHPVEYVENEPNKRPQETLSSFLKDKINAQNIVLLEPHQFSINDLVSFLTCGLIWRSSVAMELTFLGVPCIIAGNPIYHAIQLYYSRNQSDYFKMIDNASKLEVTQEQQNDVTKYLYLLKNKHIFVNCISYHSKLNKPCWNARALNNYLKNGNANIKRIAEKIIS
jgi:hypothetical protein